MPKSHDQVTPKTYFLNEQHELPHDEKRGGGQLPKFANIDWAAKGETLNQTLNAAVQRLDGSKDPLRRERYFLLAAPAPVEKTSTDKKKAPDGTFVEPTDFSRTQSRVFGRLGLDLIEVTDDGRAVVHAKAERLEQLKLWSGSLDQLGAREQARWATLDSFDTIPPDLRIDSQWWQSLKKKLPVDALVELQPLLTRSEVERVMRSIADLLLDKQQEKLTATGSDLSGRFWLRGSISPESLREIANEFFSVQSLHPPLYSMAAAISRSRSAASAALAPPTAIDVSTLPSIGVLDSGVPDGHVLLAPYRRGTVVGPTSIGRAVGDHGSKVASRIVFGEQDFSGGVNAVAGSCRFLDVQVSMGHGQYDDKGILDALVTAIRAHPDVRVFNLSLADQQPVDSYTPVERRERLRSLQDLDCLVFETDVVVVVAAGNTLAGVVPTPAYPDHVEVQDWRLGVWASGFNTLVCGSYVGRLGIGGLAQLGWPSPFTRIGPGIAGAPVPGYSAAGGNSNAAHRFVPGLGEWVCTDVGRWEDHSGTSFAAPLLAREAAFGFDLLQHYCQQGARPFGLTLKAFVALA
ncbi:MAG TPA: S8 family serine peptidase, partial [Pirellulales bacterium]|nr:S8 family serine peptidase [Pirellulales bacterium]